ncbi:formate/nitrite transporter family protein [Neofamilia massiliensis]|uniref:formate/nitrite transporter family protein n=1 Tax=Neofamilia massiliensis TaxID=1673724 RepID=UPI0006BB976E|nr:formate/nitrite transporter family protein [Neofamilia massiliensis]
MKKYKDFIYSIMAGTFIALGGVVFLMIDNKYLGSLMFAVGLFGVCTLGYNLFTGKVGYFFYNEKKSYTKFLLKVLIGNALGAILIAFLLSLSRNGEFLQEKALTLVNTKLNDTYLSLFVLGIMCNIFVVFGVEEYKTNPHDLGKYLGIIFAVMVFILAGFEHSVADIFYFAMAGVWTLDGFLRILVIVLGNAVGGLLVPSVRLLERE